MNKKAIICVDDEKIILKSLKEELIRNFDYKYEIFLAEGASEALDLINELKSENYEIPLVIADYIMPEMKGDELMENIHNISPSTYNIMLSGQANIEGVTNAVNNANLFKFIEKPWSMEELKEIIKEAFLLYENDRAFLEESDKLKEKNLILKNKLRNLDEERKAASSDDSIIENNIDVLNKIHEPLLCIKSKIDLMDKSANNTEKTGIEALCDESINQIENIINNLDQIKSTKKSD